MLNLGSLCYSLWLDLPTITLINKAARHVIEKSAGDSFFPNPGSVFPIYINPTVSTNLPKQQHLHL